MQRLRDLGGPLAGDEAAQHLEAIDAGQLQVQQHDVGLLQGDLAALQLVLERPHFGAGETTIGAELELNLIDAAAQQLL